MSSQERYSFCMSNTYRCDVLVVGAGIAGQAVASRLDASKFDVLLIEGGENHSFRAAATSKGSPQRLNISQVRGFGLGGSSKIWGGGLVPFTNLEVNSELWPNLGDSLDEELIPALEFLGFGDQAIRVADEWRRNFLNVKPNNFSFQSVFRLRKHDLSVMPSDTLGKGIKILEGFWCKEIFESETQKYVICLDKNNQEIRIKYRFAVLANGGLESLRTLFNSKRNLTLSENLGKYWSPHQTGIIGLFQGKIKFPIGDSIEGDLIRNRYIHISSTLEPGMSSWKISLFKMRTSLLELPKLWPVGITILLEYLKAKILKNEIYLVNVDGDQSPNPLSRVSLNGDGYLKVHHALSEADLESLQGLMKTLSSELNCFGDLKFFKRPHRFYCGRSHHLGGARMGKSIESGVVDRDLKLFGTSGVFVCSAAVFPTFSSANPTLTLTQFALRLGRHLNRTLSA